MTDIGLRIDVDTLKGTCEGVPNLLDLLDAYHIRATFFFSVGPDNMGRHLWRLLRPEFLIKMLRTRAASLYGWDILLKGVFWTGPVIGKKCRKPIEDTEKAGHEIGLHAFDHYYWQTHVEKMDRQEVVSQIKQGYDLLSRIIGRNPDCFAAPAWRITSDALLALGHFPFKYSSDCRGESIFQPLLAGRPIGHIQVPTTMSTYDELIGVKCSQDTYNDYIISMIKPDHLNVLTIHAEVEGNACLAMFKEFLKKISALEYRLKPLGDILSGTQKIDRAGLGRLSMQGRDGWLAKQISR